MKSAVVPVTGTNSRFPIGVRRPRATPIFERLPDVQGAIPQTPASIAEARIERLTALARAAAVAGEPERARTYVRRARRIAERHRLSLPRELARFSCDACDRFLVPGRNARVRTQDGHVVVTCECGNRMRYPYR